MLFKNGIGDWSARYKYVSYHICSSVGMSQIICLKLGVDESVDAAVEDMKYRQSYMFVKWGLMEYNNSYVCQFPYPVCTLLM